jgi:acetyl-CoA carboxylase carboxyl transferase subunit beta
VAWFSKDKELKSNTDSPKKRVPEGLWIKCISCKEMIYRKEVEKNLNVCPKCNYHYRLNFQERLRILFDDDLYQEFDASLQSLDPLKFKDSKKYKDRLKTSKAKTALEDAVVSVEGKIGGIPVILCVFEFGFMGGSMGSVVGEKITRAIERAIQERKPFITISCSGGARMQEGILSLMQMAKICAALTRLSEAGLLFISILTDPTTGGVTASFAMLGDVIMAEPGALIGFAGPRVIQQTIRQELPPGFQTSEFLLQHGIIDLVVSRKDMRVTLDKLLNFFVS